MELPKNITQIGESDRSCKVYVEDYVVSYIKQLNQLASSKDMAAALYGTQKMENNIRYLFIYGACKLDFLQRETRHLSQAQQQEVEKLRTKYFPEQEFLGYCLLNGEMVEGFQICEQNTCRYIGGYAQFYEKNDDMLAYMLDTRATEAPTEEVDLEKYHEVRKRQEERREEYRSQEPALDYVAEAKRLRAKRRAENKNEAQGIPYGVRKMRISAVAVFGILCVAGLAMLGEGQEGGNLEMAAKQVLSNLTEQKLPDTEESILVTQDKLAEAVLTENEEMKNLPVISEVVVNPQPTQTSQPTQVPQSTPTPQPTQTLQPTQTPQPEMSPAPAQTPVPTEKPSPDAAGANASYTIQKGDTLIDICLRQYGTEKMVKEVCAVNNIANPDNIKVGEKILLP